jgi:membrane-associated HD superfamily phosphohydrolase
MTNPLKNILLLFALLSLTAIVPCAVYAEDAGPEAAETSAEKPAEEKAAEQPLDPEAAAKSEKYEKAATKAYDAIKEIGKDLKESDAKHFYMTYNNYNLAGTVKMVQGDVANAIKACGENNPNMKNDLDARYKTWDEAVAPVVKEAEANIDNMILAQEYADPAKIRKAFGALDEARKVTNEYVDKKPVTTEDACKSLLEKMDDTQENLISLLRTTLISVGRNFPETNKEAEEKPAEEVAPEKSPEQSEEQKP